MMIAVTVSDSHSYREPVTKISENKRLNKISGIPSKDDYIKTPYGIGRVMEFIEDSDMYKIKLAFGIVFVSDAESKVTNYFKKFIKEDQDINNNNKILSSPSTKK